MEKVHIDEIEKFFQNFDYSKINGVEIKPYQKIENLPFFVLVNLKTLRQHSGNRLYYERYIHLLEVYYYCKNTK